MRLKTRNEALERVAIQMEHQVKQAHARVESQQQLTQDLHKRIQEAEEVTLIESVCTYVGRYFEERGYLQTIHQATREADEQIFVHVERVAQEQNPI